MDSYLTIQRYHTNVREIISVICYNNEWTFKNYIKVSVLLLNNISLSLAGLLMIICPFLSSYEMLVICSIPLGFALCKYSVQLYNRMDEFEDSPFCVKFSYDCGYKADSFG